MPKTDAAAKQPDDSWREALAALRATLTEQPENVSPEEWKTLLSAMTTSDEPPKPGPFAWDPDPIVVVSRRNRILHFPGALLSGPVSEDQRARWFAPPEGLAASAPGLLRNQDQRDLELNYGATFLGVCTSAWKYRAADDRNAPRGAPPDADRVLIEPAGRHARPILTGPAFKDPETGERRPDLITAAWLRVLAFLRDARNEAAAALFTAPDGYDAPEIVVLPLSEVLKQTTEVGRLAYPLVLDAAGRSRNLAHLGALHDYAVRERSASAITAACRRRAQSVSPSRL